MCRHNVYWVKEQGTNVVEPRGIGNKRTIMQCKTMKQKSRERGWKLGCSKQVFSLTPTDTMISHFHCTRLTENMGRQLSQVINV